MTDMVISIVVEVVVIVLAFWLVIEKLNGIHLQLNSRMDQLIAASKAQGRQDERDDSERRTEEAR
jgi:hypothetical protein